MVKSMTGYGRYQQTVESMNITVEIKSVNHRYFDFSSRTPRIYGFLDEKLKSYVQSRVARGKIECYVQVDNLEDDSVIVRLQKVMLMPLKCSLKLIQLKTISMQAHLRVSMMCCL